MARSQICRICKVRKSIYEFYRRKDSSKPRAECKVCHRRLKRKCYIKDRSKILTQKGSPANKSRRNIRDRKRGEENKRKVIRHYSNGTMRCRCGYSDIRALCIDHINNDGKEERRQLGVSGRDFYRYLIKNKYPKGYQVLCFNCNQIKSLNC